jgi:drug/metabolite transporter (DMT)-like permease
VAWGATFVVVKAAVRRINPELFLTLRFAIGGLILLAVASMRREIHRNVWRGGIVLGIFVAAGYVLQTRGLMTISPSRSAFLTGLTVVIIPAADWLLFRKRISIPAAVAAFIALGGTIVLTGGWSGSTGPGELMTIGCAIAFALHVALMARYSREHPANALAAAQILAVAVLISPFAARAPLDPLGDRTVVAAIAITAVVTTALAFLAMTWSQARLTATEAGIVLSFEPVAAALTSVFWEGEQLSVNLVLGGTLIFAAMLLSQTGVPVTLAAGGPLDDVTRSPDPRQQRRRDLQ